MMTAASPAIPDAVERLSNTATPRATVPTNGASPNDGDTRLSGLPWLVSLLTGTLDELDYGIVIVDPDGRLIQANQVGQGHCTDPAGPCRLLHGHLTTRLRGEEQLMRRALDMAVREGRRSLLRLGEADRAESIAVVPLANNAVLFVFGRRQMCELLSVEHFARVNGLTNAEGLVLAALCDGDEPGAIARKFGVALSTVRSQITSIRQKTRTSSIRDLVRQVALLPPIVSALGREAAH